MDEGTFTLHLVGGSWVAVDVATQEAWENEPEEDHTEGDFPPALPGLDPEVWERIDEVVDDLTTSMPISDHRDAHRLLDVIMNRIEQTAPGLVERLRTLQGYIASRGAVTRLQAALKEEHITAMQRDARDWAEKVYEQNPIPARSRRPAFQEAAYRFMKRLDGQCATRMTTEPIASALEVVAEERAGIRRG